MNEKIYRVTDTESGEWVLYDGNSLMDAKNTILESIEEDKSEGIEPVKLDLECDGDTIWSAAINTICELEKL